jgi:myo-inositol catabolism protein IolS
MNQRFLGNSRIKVTEQILGCWAIGGSYWGGTDDRESIATIKAAIEGGISTLDTAYIYGNGHSERIVGEGIKGYDREKLILITKLWKSEMSQDRIEKACDDSLRAMGTDYADIYFIHYPSEDIPIEETMNGMMKLKEKGKIKSIGLSNFSLDQMKEAMRYGKIDVIQPCYSLVWRFLDHEELPFCIENNIGVITYCTLAQGILTGKFTKDKTFSEDDGRSKAPIFQQPYFEEALQVTEHVKKIALKYDKTPSQIAINWVINTRGITAPIVGARTVKQIEENLKASSFTLDPEDYEYLDRVSRKFTDTLPAFETFFKA